MLLVELIETITTQNNGVDSVGLAAVQSSRYKSIDFTLNYLV